jgi:hypothetical protein
MGHCSHDSKPCDDVTNYCRYYNLQHNHIPHANMCRYFLKELGKLGICEIDDRNRYSNAWCDIPDNDSFIRCKNCPYWSKVK